MALTRPAPWQSAVAWTAVAILAGFGTWQVQRAAWKRDLIAERQAQLVAPPVTLPREAVDPRAWHFRRVAVEGRFRHDREAQLYALRLGRGTPGYRILTPLETEAGPVLVDRGWVPLDRKDPATRQAGQTGGPVRVVGIARAAASRGDFVPENDPARAAWYWLDLPALAAATGLPLREVFVEADDTPNPDSLPIGGQTRIDLTDNHLAYAFVWYSLALACAGIFALYRRRLSRDTP